MRLALEIDGPTHENDAAAVYDAARQQAIEALSVRFLRFSNEQVYHRLPQVMETILATIARLQMEGDPLCPPDTAQGAPAPSTRGRARVETRCMSKREPTREDAVES